MAEEQQEVVANMYGEGNWVPASDAQGEGGTVRQEIVIDIHVRNLKLQVQELVDGSVPEAEEGSKGLAVRIVWSRGKKEAKTQYRYLRPEKDEQKFDEKIQINTVLDLNPETQMPIKEKNSRLAISLNRNYGYQELAEVQFDMADFKYGRYNGQRLFLQAVESEDQKFHVLEGGFLEIGIKGTRADGLVMQRMSLIKSKITDTIKKQMQFGGNEGSDPNSPLAALMSPTSPGRQRPSGDDNTALLQEIEKLKREKSQLNAQLSASNSAQQLTQNQIRSLEEDLVKQKDAERELRDMQQYVAELERSQGAAVNGDAPNFGSTAAKDEEYDKLKQRFGEVEGYMLSLYDISRFDTSYLTEAAPFLKSKPALPLKPAKAPAAAGATGKADAKQAASKTPAPAATKGPAKAGAKAPTKPAAKKGKK